MRSFTAVVVIAGMFSVARASEFPIQQSLACSGTINLSCPSHTSGSLSSSDCPLKDGGWFDQYAISLPGSADFRATATGAQSLPLLVFLLDPVTGDLFDWSSGFGSATISYHPPDPNLLYTLVVATTSSAGGAYTLDVSCQAPPPPTQTTCEWSGDLFCGSVVKGETKSNECPSSAGTFYFDYFKLGLIKGQTVEITATGDFPISLYIDEAKFTGGVYVKGATTAPQSVIFTAGQDGIHQVSITTASKLLTTSYTLSVNCVAPCSRQRSAKH